MIVSTRSFSAPDSAYAILRRCSGLMRPIALAAFFAGAVPAAFAQATSTTWTSSSETEFFTGGNWDAGAPADDLTSHIAHFSTPDLAYPVLTASQSVAGLSISSPTTFSATGGAILTVGSSNIIVSNTSGEVAISAPLAGTASFTKSGAGTLTLSGANTYSGGTTLSKGSSLNLAHASSLGSGTLTLNTDTGDNLNNTSGAALTLSTNNAVAFNGNRIAFTGTHDLNLGTGTVTLNTGVKTFDVSANTLTIGGAVTGAGGLRKFGNGHLVLTGATSFGALTVSSGTVTLAGPSTRTGMNGVNQGATLNINHASALGTGSLGININPKIDNTSGAAITLTTNNAQIWNSDFTFIGSNSLNLGTGTVTPGLSFGRITVSANTLTVGGEIKGGGGLVKAGAGTLELGGQNTYTEATVVNAGTLLVSGSTAGGNVTVNSGATLGGTGMINGSTTIASGGTLAPGHGAGLLTFSSYLSLADGSTTIFQINGADRGNTFDAIDLTQAPVYYGGDFDLVFGSTIAGGTTLNLFGLSDGASGSFSSILASGSYNGLFTNDSGIWTLVDGSQILTFIESTGDLSFSGSAIPEPSTYAVLFGAAILGFAAWRRRKLQAT